MDIKYTENLQHLLKGGFKVYRRAQPTTCSCEYLIVDPKHESKHDTKTYHPVHLEGEQVMFTQAIADA